MNDSAQNNRRVMSENIQRLMEENGKTRTDVCRDLGIKYSTLSEWIQGFKYPRIQNIELLAEYFGVPKSELVEKHGEAAQLEEDALDRQLFAAYGKVKQEFDADDIEDIKTFMTMIAERKRKRREKGEGH